ncbi:MAG: exodeoxyribonuclease VII small subunit [bacterium]|jgi:exodeoxyribonuclease VII small subunit
MSKSKKQDNDGASPDIGGLIPDEDEALDFGIAAAGLPDSAGDTSAATRDSLDDFETTFERLKAIASELEREDIKLGDMVKLFEEGVALIKQCDKFLKEARSRVEKYIQRTDDGRWVIKGLEEADAR